MNKSEFYKSIVEMQSKTGQGVPKFVAENGDLMDELNELIDEKMVTVTCIPSLSVMFPDDYWIVPTGCYNLWTEKNHMLCLMYVRKFLNILEEDDHGMNHYITYGKGKDEYLVWLDKNREQLSNMLTLESDYLIAYYNIHNTFPRDPSKLSDAEVNYISEFKFTKEREKGTTQIRVKHLENLITERISVSNQLIENYEAIIRLTNGSQREEYEKSLSECLSEVSIEKAILKKIKNIDKEKLIEDINK